MHILKPMSLGLLSRVSYLRHRHVLVLGATAAFPLDDPTRLIFDPAFWKAATPLLEGAALDHALAKPQGEVLLAGSARAPATRPVQAMDVAFRVGPVARTIRVFGDRVWQEGAMGRMPSAPIPYTEMPLSAGRAFGGPDFPENPAGRGHGAAALLRLGRPAPLPNLEDPARSLARIDEAPPPMLTGPVELTAPSRQRMAGTYDGHYLRDHHPGLPPDADMRIFQAAQPAQWSNGFFTGDEEIVLAGFRPEREPQFSRLPGMRVRAFARRQAASGEVTEIEVELRIDTVWLFPDAGIGCCIHRGMLPVGDPDAKDVPAVLLAYERLKDAPRPVAHYQEQLRLRTDPATAANYLLREGPLKPEPSAAEREQRQAARAQKRAEMLEEMRRGQALQQKQIERQLGLVPGMLPAPPEPELPDFPIITDADIEALDIDLGEIWEAFDRQIAKVEAMTDGPPADMPPDLAHLIAAAEGKPAPAGEPSADLTPAVTLLRGIGDPATHIAQIPAAWDAETRAKAEELILAALAPSSAAADLAEAWRKLEARLRGDVSDHPAVRGVAGLTLPDMDLSEPPVETTPEGRASAEAARARRDATPDGLPDLDALLAGLEAGGAGDRPAPATADIAAARAKLTQGVAAAFPGLAHLPPGEALREALGPMLAQREGPPPDRAALEKIIADAKKRAEALARDDAMAEVRRMSPEPLPEAAVWDPSFEPRLRALLTELAATPEGLAGRDFHGVALPGLALPGAALAGSFWERASLSGANLAGAELRGAVFCQAELGEADLSGADLTEANFARARLDRTRLAGARLDKAVWFETQGEATDFSGARLSEAMAIQCHLPGAHFAGAELLDGIFVMSDLKGADFTGATLTRCIFMRCDLTAAKLGGARLEGCAFIDSPMADAEASDAVMKDVAFLLGQLPRARFRRVRGDNLTLLAADLTDADFAGADLPAVTLMQARLSGASFRQARLRGAVLNEAQAEDADFGGADLFEAQLRNAVLRRASLMGASLYSANLEGAELAMADLTGANLRLTLMERPSDVA